eukprot:5641520-Ditylum_brightwellii.AAC.1
MINTYSFKISNCYVATNAIRNAMKQVINITGNLHAGCFHFLSAISFIFYGALLQPVQVLLRWKQIRGTDVTKCYQQAAGLALMIADELECHLIATFFDYVFNDPIKKEEFDNKEDPEEFVILVARAFLLWLDTKQETTTNEMGCRFDSCVPAPPPSPHLPVPPTDIHLILFQIGIPDIFSG